MREHYLPTEYHILYKIISGHSEKNHSLPSFEDLKFGIRDTATQEKLFAIESVEVEADAPMLLQYLKNEYTQREILKYLNDYVENSVAFEDAEEAVAHLHQIVMDVEEKVELEQARQSMQRITLFETEEELGKYLSLGLNKDFDLGHQFSPRDLVLIGGRRGAGKSVTCANVAVNVYNQRRSSIYYTIEMDERSILQRMCSVATGVSATRLKSRSLSVTEWDQVAIWWADRFEGGQEVLSEYYKHHDFDKLHTKLISTYKLWPSKQLDVVYDPSLTIAKLRADLDRKVKGKMDLGVIIVDYINKLKYQAMPNKKGSYDWTEQLEVSNALKHIAQDYDTTVFSPYQIDASGEARFAKGILDDADAAYTLDTYKEEDACVTFKCVKMRDGPMRDFTSVVDWNSLKMGPESALTPKEREESKAQTDEPIHDL